VCGWHGIYDLATLLNSDFFRRSRVGYVGKTPAPKKRNIANLEEAINRKSWKFAESCRVSLVGLWRKWKRWGTARFDIIVNGKHCNLPTGSQCPLWV
jgi:hypothetical protein